MTESAVPFRVRIPVRISDLDPQLHVTGSAYQQYADHARFACVAAAGVSVPDLLAAGFGPVNLELNIRYLRELRADDTVEIDCRWSWGAGKTYRVDHTLTRDDGEVAATVSFVAGLLDLNERKLVADPARVWGEFAKDRALLGLA
ncbi:acyl-CoA thioesterase [Nocardia asteroides]|uniref:acyl-CoA thioesterase n=1 Tax=Nocardia asteroides TaxID=1824 RepID=UPI001E28B3D8|nr:acyl-CoA thioesterase [Nocardia asteroides]UGT56572.1 acyl-CoA thioesterase [Nocardia asteroides]